VISEPKDFPEILHFALIPSMVLALFQPWWL